MREYKDGVITSRPLRTNRDTAVRKTIREAFSPGAARERQSRRDKDDDVLPTPPSIQEKVASSLSSSVVPRSAVTTSSRKCSTDRHRSFLNVVARDESSVR